MLELGQFPACPSGERILVLPDPPDEESQLIVKPEDREYRPNKGRILAAGLRALDKLHDNGAEVGDEVWWGKFAGVMEEWDRLEAVTKKGETCDHSWVRAPLKNRPHDKKWTCECGSSRLASHILVLNVEDILANVSLQRRIENGVLRVIRGKLSNGATQHVIERE